MSEDDGRVKDLTPPPATTESSRTPSEPLELMPTITGVPSGLTGEAATPETQFIGPYKLLRRLGEGGMGQVWLAEQTEPVHRQVALKLIRVGRYDDDILQRFRSERQSLAMMDHPSIAKVFDAGATPDIATTSASRSGSAWNFFPGSAKGFSTRIKRPSSTEI
jgi:serine/threonine protein kinase